MTFALCDEISISTEPFPRAEVITTAEDIVITPVGADADDPNLTPVQSLFASGVHFLSHDSILSSLLVPKEEPLEDIEDDSSSDVVPGRKELLEYLIQEDGTVVCKWCGEVLPSRTHWYRHKYKFHALSPPSTSSLFKCYRCNVFFKSRKGYIGHINSRHSDKKSKTDDPDSVKGSFKSLDIPLSRGRRALRSIEDVPGSVEEYEKQREKEEKLVAEIIDRVKKECEAQGSTVTRRGYSRRTTVMNT